MAADEERSGTYWIRRLVPAAALVAVVMGLAVLVLDDADGGPRLDEVDRRSIAAAWQGDLGGVAADELELGLTRIRPIDPDAEPPAGLVRCAGRAAAGRPVTAAALVRLPGTTEDAFAVEVADVTGDVVLVAATDDCRLLERVPVAPDRR